MPGVAGAGWAPVGGVAGWEAIGPELDPAGNVSAPIVEPDYPTGQERPAII